MKYMGSKSRIAKYIVPILQECIDSNNVTTLLHIKIQMALQCLKFLLVG